MLLLPRPYIKEKVHEICKKQKLKIFFTSKTLSTPNVCLGEPWQMITKSWRLWASSRRASTKRRLRCRENPFRRSGLGSTVLTAKRALLEPASCDSNSARSLCKLGMAMLRKAKNMFFPNLTCYYFI
jgi:hypothetical protein